MGSENSLHQFHNTALHIGIVGDRAGDRDLAGSISRYALPNECPGIDQQSGADPFFQTMILEVPHLSTEFHKLAARSRLTPASRSTTVVSTSGAG